LNYIAVDFEWNQAYCPPSKKKNELIIQLDGEIIQIGAVKMDKDTEVLDTFEADIHPVFYRKIHKKVKELTGIDQSQLNKGDDFKVVIEEFKKWCGDDHIFLTWGPDDSRIMMQNLIKHNLPTDWMGKWVNLQVIFNMQTGMDTSQVSLKTAIEAFEIPQILHAHNAINDATYTAMICKCLELEKGIKDYYSTKTMSSLKHTACESYKIIRNCSNKVSVFANENIKNIKCPHCKAELSNQKPWIKQSGDRYITIGKCPEHGMYVSKLKLYRLKDKSLAGKYSMFASDGSDEEYYNNLVKANNERIRRRRRKKIAVKKQADV